MTKTKEYFLREADIKKLIAGEQIHFYHGKELDIFLKLDVPIQGRVSLK